MHDIRDFLAKSWSFQKINRDSEFHCVYKSLMHAALHINLVYRITNCDTLNAKMKQAIYCTCFCIVNNYLPWVHQANIHMHVYAFTVKSNCQYSLMWPTSTIT